MLWPSEPHPTHGGVRYLAGAGYRWRHLGRESGSCWDRFSEQELPGSQTTGQRLLGASTCCSHCRLGGGEAKRRAQRERQKSRPSQSLTQCSECWTLVVEVLGADLTHGMGIHLLQGEAQGTLTDRHQGHLCHQHYPADWYLPRGPWSCPLVPKGQGSRALSSPVPVPAWPPSPRPVTPALQTMLPRRRCLGYRGCLQRSLRCRASTPRPLRVCSVKSPEPLPGVHVTAIRLSHSVRGMRRP